MRSVSAKPGYDRVSVKVLLAIIPLLYVITSCQENSLSIDINLNDRSPKILHGISKLKVIEEEMNTVSEDRLVLNITGSIDSLALGPEAYQLAVNEQNVEITAGDESGMMYALLDIRDQLRSGVNRIEEKREHPRLSFRAIKYNLPWDSYRNSEALDLHYETCRDTTYWKAFLDMMADNRLNVLTLWNLHPFSYLVKTEKYPEATPFSDEEMGDWEVFWETLFRMAKDRGIETYLINWNIFVSPEFAKAHGVAEYSIENEYITNQGDTSEIIKDYMREAVREVIDTYPDLSGLGITLGEGMGGMTAEEREEWLLDSYVEGMRRASRKVKFIHRVPLSANTQSGGSTSLSVEKMTRNTLDTLSCVEGPLTIELKFNWSHAYSSPHLVKVHGGKLSDTYWNPMPENYRLSWMMRNEDFFMLRWGQSDFIRQHIALNTPEYVQGYFIGSECYIPAKDYFTVLPGASYQYAFDRQWMYYHMWGRLLYNPEIPDHVFEQAFLNRFPGFGGILYSAQQKVSKVPLIIASYMNATWDYTLYSEGLMTLREGEMRLISIDQLGKTTPLDPNYIGIGEYLDQNFVQSSEMITPVQLADSLASFCLAALEEVKNVDPGTNTDLQYELSDIKIWAHIGWYFSNKLRAAMEKERYDTTNDEQYLSNAIAYLEASVDNWESLVEESTPVYEAVPLVHYNRSDRDKFHWTDWEEEINLELQTLRALKN